MRDRSNTIENVKDQDPVILLKEKVMCCQAGFSPWIHNAYPLRKNKKSP